jgi:hypothetical protein
MKKYRLTLIGLFLSLFIYLVIHMTEADLFERFIVLLRGFEDYELDEVLIPFFIFAIFAFADIIIRQHTSKVELHKVKIYKAMLHSTHHVLNNFLNQMQLFKIAAQETRGFPADVLEMYDEIIKDASKQINALGSITSIDDASILDSVASKPKPGTQQGDAFDANKPRA